MNTRKTVESSLRKEDRTRKDGSEGTDGASALTPSHSPGQRDPRESRYQVAKGIIEFIRSLTGSNGRP